MLDSVQIKVKGGLPVTVEFDIEAADESAGYMYDTIYDYRIAEISGRKVTDAKWLEKQLNGDQVTKAIFQAIKERAHDAY